MPAASSLKDLLKIRHANRVMLEKFNGVWGTALGRKDGTDQPAVLVFVPRKIDKKWLPKGQVVPAALDDGHGLTCPTDVIQATEYETSHPPPTLSKANIRLRDELWGASPALRPGSQIACWDKEGYDVYGTLACFVKHTTTGAKGFLTNQQIGI